VRGQGYQLEPWLSSRLNHFFVIHRADASFPAAEGAYSAEFRCKFGPLGSGEAVVGFREAEVRQWLTEVNDKTLALETEAGGVAQEYHESALRSGYRAAGYLIVRGISDHADQAKDDRWRLPASRNAMQFLERLLQGWSAL